MVNYNINLLHAVYDEYGLDTFIKRLKKVYNIDISIANGITITFLPSQISISYTEGNLEDSIITFNEGSYQHVKYFKDYFVTTRYDNNHYQFEKIFSFYTSDHTILALDEIDAINIKCRRLIKTTAEDKELLFGEYEKEQRVYTSPNASEIYTFKNNLGNITIKKTIGMNNGLYYFSYKSSNSIPNKKPVWRILEVGSITNKPILNTAGRTRNNNELLIESVKKGTPNIIIRGAILDAESPNNFFKITIIKSEEGITIHYTAANTTTMKQNNKVIIVPLDNKGEFSLTEIDNIITSIRNNLTATLQEDFNSEISISSIIAELTALQEEIQVNKHKKTRNPDVIDFKLNQYESIEHLAFDIYENLPKYEAYINNYPSKFPNDQTHSLKKAN